jgi:hypothetical protein
MYDDDEPAQIIAYLQRKIVILMTSGTLLRSLDGLCPITEQLLQMIRNQSDANAIAVPRTNR